MAQILFTKSHVAIFYAACLKIEAHFIPDIYEEIEICIEGCTSSVRIRAPFSKENYFRSFLRKAQDYEVFVHDGNKVACKKPLWCHSIIGYIFYVIGKQG